MFQENSHEAIIYTSYGELIHQIKILSPFHGVLLLQWMLQKWPHQHVALDFFYLKFLQDFLIPGPPPVLSELPEPLPRPNRTEKRTGRTESSHTGSHPTGTQLPSFLLDGIFQKIAKKIQSPHTFIAKKAMEISSHLQLIHFYLMTNSKRREQIASALHFTSIHHWNLFIREKAEENFDLLLDFA
jgi:hypothetical protein